MAYKTFDYRCAECAHEAEEFLHEPVPLDCPECKAPEAFVRVYRSFSIIQREATKDTSNSWLGKGGRTAYGKNRAVNGGF